MSRDDQGEPVVQGPAVSERLEGWGQIARYLHRGPRTVQRWEKEIGLPVRRLGGTRTSAVYALRSELDTWREAMETGGLGDRLAPTAEDAPATVSPQDGLGRRAILIGSALLAASLLLGWHALASRGRSSQTGGRYEIASRTLRLVEPDQAVRWTYEFEQPLESDYLALPEGDSRGPSSVDLEGDGKRETLFPARSPSGQPHEVFVFESDGRVRLRWRPHRSVQFGSVRYDPPLDAGFLAIPAEGRPGRLWAVARHRLWFPSLLAEVDRHGRTVEEYWSSGPILALRPARVLGRRVLLVGGAASEFWSASLSVLDPERLSGSTPATATDYTCVDCPQGTPLAAVVFPRSDLGGLSDSWSYVDQISAGEYGMHVDVVEKIRLGPKAATQVVETRARFAFDPDFVFMGGSTDDSHAALHDALTAARRIDHPFGEQDRAHLQQVLAWNGRRFAAIGIGVPLVLGATARHEASAAASPKRQHRQSSAASR